MDLSNLDLSKFWTRTIGVDGERMITSAVLTFATDHGGGYKARANLDYLEEEMRAVTLPEDTFSLWERNRQKNPPKAIIARSGKAESQGWILFDGECLKLIKTLARKGVFNESYAKEVLLEWEDEAFKRQARQFIPLLYGDLFTTFMLQSKQLKAQLAWDAYVYAKTTMHLEPTATFSKSVINVRRLGSEWLRYAKAKFPRTNPVRGRLPRLAV